MASQSGPPNPFYWLLLITGVVFVMTVLAYGVIPAIEQKAIVEGTKLPPSPFREASKVLDRHGAKWVLAEVAALVVFGLLSMGLDRYHRWKEEHGNAAGPRDESGDSVANGG